MIYQVKSGKYGGVYHETLWALNAQEAVNKVNDRVLNENFFRIISVQEVGTLWPVVDGKVQ